MRLKGVRGSKNVEDRRRMSGGGKAGIGGVGLLVVLASTVLPAQAYSTLKTRSQPAL